MNSFIKVLLKYCLLILFGTSIGILFLEVGVRILGAKPETYLRKFSEHHPILGWVKKPNMEGEFIRGDARIREKMNSKGLRDIEYDYAKPEKVMRILVMGDSFTEGYDVDFENIFTEFLERQLNIELSAETGLKYEVINAGTGGYSTDQEYLFYKTEGYKYQPDIVLLMVYAANDIYYNNESKYGNYYKPLFRIQGDSLKLVNTPLPEPRRQESLKGIFRDMALYPIVTKVILTKLPSVASALSEWGFISQSTLETTRPALLDSSARMYPSSFSIFAKTPTEKVSMAWKVTDFLIRDLKHSADMNGSSVILFAVPDRFQVYPDSWAATKIQYNVDEKVWDPKLPNSILENIAVKYQIPFFDFASFLNTDTAKYERLYNGVHWNIRGNEIAGKFIFQELMRRGLIKK